MKPKQIHTIPRGVAESLLIESGKSEHLKGIFRNITESECLITDTNVRRKYDQNTAFLLARIIACRTYGRACLEFIYACVVAHHVAQPRESYIDLFMRAVPANRHYFKGILYERINKHSGSILKLQPSGVLLSTDFEEFLVHFERLPVMSALLDFVVEAVGFIKLDEILKPVLRSTTKNTVNEAAKALSKLIYHFLSDHLPTAQIQARYQAMIAHFSHYWEDAEDQTVSIGPSDEDIIRFWMSHAREDNLNFKTYRSVVVAIIDFVAALERAQSEHAMSHAHRLGTNREADERDVSAEDTFGIVTDIWSESEGPLAALESEQAHLIKFFNKSEKSMIDALLMAGPSPQNLPLTHLRWHTFGGAQARLSQAKRRKLSSSEMTRFITEDAIQKNYNDIMSVWSDVVNQCQRSILASAMILMSSGRLNGLICLKYIFPDLDFDQVIGAYKTQLNLDNKQMDADEVVLPFRSNDPTQPIGDTELLIKSFTNSYRSKAWSLSDVEIAAVAAAERAFKDLNRDGFKSRVIRDEQMLDSFEAVVPTIEWIKKQFSALYRVIEDMEKLDERFAADEARFKPVFQLLYGEDK